MNCRGNPRVCPRGGAVVDFFAARCLSISEIFLATGTVSCILRVEFGAWLSPVERLLREQEAPGSNPGAPTIKKQGFMSI